MFLNLLSDHPDIVATLTHTHIPFEALGGIETRVYDRLHQHFSNEDFSVVTHIAQLVYIAGKNLDWLHVERVTSDVNAKAAYAFYEPGDMITTIPFSNKECLTKLFCYTQLRRFTEHISVDVVPSVTIAVPG